MLYIRSLEWDAWNEEHIARHGVTKREVEDVCHGNHLVYRQSYKGCIMLLGVVGADRILAVILGAKPEQPPGVYYVFTSHPADRKERRIFNEYFDGGRS